MFTGRRKPKGDKPEEPTEVWIEAADGGRIDCTLTRTGPHAWTAQPQRRYTLMSGDQVRVDVLPPSARIELKMEPPGGTAPMV